MQRYAVITEKNPREIVLLRGRGCAWRRCTFCDYHLDFSTDEDANFRLNSEALSHVDGKYGDLEVINSGSFCDLDDKTMDLIEDICEEKDIRTLHFECHWMHRGEVPALRRRFAAAGVSLKLKIGIETFDAHMREDVMKKGIAETDPAVLSRDFDEVNLLFGIEGQTEESMRKDIETGLKYFERVCVNIMTPNTAELGPDESVIKTFREKVLPDCADDERIDILMENTDFGVGSPDGEEEGGGADA
jgi:hypothetical protein